MAKVVCVSHNTRTQRGLCRLLHAGLGGPCANRVFPQLGCDSTDNKSSSPSFAQLPSSTGGNGWANFAAVAPVESSLMMVGFLATHHQARGVLFTLSRNVQALHFGFSFLPNLVIEEEAEGPCRRASISSFCWVSRSFMLARCSLMVLSWSS